MTMPALNVPAAPLANTPSMALEFPVEALIGAFAALAVLAIGVAATGYLRTKRAASTAPVPRWAS